MEQTLLGLTNPQVALVMMFSFIFIVLLGFPIAFTLLAIGIFLDIMPTLIHRKLQRLEFLQIGFLI